jgi:hypothetical protein
MESPSLPRPLLLLLLCVCLLAGCGSSTSSDAPEAGLVHPPDWLLAHDDQAREDLIGCQVCHGGDFQGIARAVSCFSCHLGGPPFFVHPPSLVQRLEWRHPINHGSWVKGDIAACQGCHGERGGAGSDPRFARSLRRMERGCESAEGCHGNGNDPFVPLDNGHNPYTAHPTRPPGNPEKQDRMHWYGERLPYVDDQGRVQIQFISHYSAGNLDGACALCHGAALQGGVGPACTACHVLSPLAEPAGCISCHGSQPVQPAALFLQSTERADPLDPLFVSEVEAGFHLAHDLLECRQRDSESACRRCHINAPLGGFDPRTNINRHHRLTNGPIPPGSEAPVPGETYGCLTCHPMRFNAQTLSFETQVLRDCAACHLFPFPEVLPCPP